MKRWPRVALGVAVALAIVLPISGWRVYHRAFAKPNPITDNISLLNQLALASQPEGENAFETIRQLLIDDLGVPGDHTGGSAWLARFRAANNSRLWLHGGSWNITDRSADVANFDAIRPLLTKLERTLDQPRFIISFPRSGDALTGELDASATRPLDQIPSTEGEVGWMRGLPEMMIVQMRIDAERGDWNQVVIDARVSLRLGEGMSQQMMVVDQLLGINAQVDTLYEIAHTIDEHDLSVKTIDELLHAIEYLNPASHAALEDRLIQAAVLQYNDTIQWVYTDDGAGDGRLIISQYNKMIDDPLTLGNIGPAANFFYDSPVTRRKAMAAVDEIERRAQSMKNFSSLEFAMASKSFKKWAFEDNSWGNAMKVFGWGGPIHSLTFSRRFYSKAAGVRVMLLLERRHIETGDWPTELTPALSIADARDPVSGELFIYRLTPNDERHRPYELVIPWMEKGDEKAVVNPPRPKHYLE